MNRLWIVLASCWMAGSALATASSPVAIDVVDPDGRTFREFPVSAADGALRSYLQAEKGSRYGVRVRNTTGERLGLVIAVDGRNIINGKKSDLARTEPMYVLDAWTTQDYSGWRANLDAVNEFYFTDWNGSYAEAFGDRSARGVIAIAVYREEAPAPIYPQRDDDSRAAGAAPSARADASAEKSAGTGYGERRVDRVVEVEFVARADADSRHFIKYEWRETLCRKRVIECGEKNRFWDESTLGFAPPPPRRH
jgi:hypothetical protein